jgi:hypothetical protein
VAVTLTGVPQTSVGQTYDLGLGLNPISGPSQMYGYMLNPGTELTEETSIDDEQRLVQIASPSSTDRWGSYPHISQGEWTGGERQLIFVDATRYYQSSKLETGIPGHLRIAGQYVRTAFPANVGNPSTGFVRTVARDTANSGGFAVAMTGGSAGNISVFRWSGASFGAIAQRMSSAGTNAVTELINAGAAMFGIVSGANPGIWQVTAGNGTSQITNDTIFAGTLCYIANTLWYALGSNSVEINKVIGPTWPGNAAGTNAQATNQVDGGMSMMCATASGLAFVTGASLNVGPSYVYTWDGASVPVYVGTVQNLFPVDMRTIGGITFLLFGALSEPGRSSTTIQPVIYSLSGSQLAVFDDYRYVDQAFQSSVAGGNNWCGNLDGDDTYLYLFWAGLSAKRYDLANTGGQSLAVSDVGDPARNGLANHFGVAGNEGSFFEWSDNPNSTNHLLWGLTTAANDTGYLITSYFDAATPGVVKYWRSFEVDLNAALGAGAGVAVAYQLDNETGFPHTLTLQATPTGDLLGVFPTPTKAKRIQLRITLTASNAGVSPDIRSYAIKPTLARVWRATVLCARSVLTHSGEDAQGAKGADLLANVASIYNNGGLCVLFVPDATSSTGVSQVNAVLEDYTRHSRIKVGPTADEFGNWDQEGTCDLVLKEDI